MSYRAGEFRHRVTIQQNTATRGTYGGKSDSWGTHSVCWAKIVSMAGRERQGGGQVNSETTHDVWVRFNRDKARITSAMRVLFGSRVFDIIAAIDPDETQEAMLLKVKERG